MTEHAPQRVGKFELREQIGVGGFGPVYRAWDAERQSDVAVRILDPYLARHDLALADGILREAQRAAGLYHENIARVLSSGDVEGTCYVATPYLPGPSLAQIIASDAPIPIERVLELLNPIAEALDEAHAHDIVHRDVKPGNIILDEHGRPMLVDFGLVDAAQDTTYLSLTGRPPCDVHYAAPEQLSSRRVAEVGPASDVYSLGAVAYHMLTGRPPFEGDTLEVMQAQATTAPPPPGKLNPHIAPAVERAVLAALAKRPKDRPQGAGQFLARLRAAASVRQPAAPSLWPALVMRLLALLIVAAGVALPTLGVVQGRGPLAFLKPAPVEATPVVLPPSPTRVPVVLPATPSAIATATARPAPSPTPPATRAPSPTPAPATHTLAPTNTPLPTSTRPPATPSAIATATPRPPTPVPPTATAAATRAPSPTPSPAIVPVSAAPLLLLPGDGALVGEMTCSPGVPSCSPKLVEFAWQWAGPPLADNQAFELRLWPRGASPDQFYHYGAAAPVRATRLTIDIASTPGLRAAGGPWRDGNTGSYWWTVAVVQTEPYARSGPEAPPRVFSVKIVQ